MGSGPGGLSVFIGQTTQRLTQRFKRRAQFFGEDFWLFPGCEVTTFFEPVVMNQFRIGFLRPTFWSCIDLIWKSAHGNRDSDILRGEKGELAFPIQPR